QVAGLLTQAGDQPLADLLPARMIALRAEQPDLPALTDLMVGHRRVMLGRPALGLAKLGTGTERQYRPIQLQAEARQRRFPAGRVDLQCWSWIRPLKLMIRLPGQRH